MSLSVRARHIPGPIALPAAWCVVCILVPGSSSTRGLLKSAVTHHNYKFAVLHSGVTEAANPGRALVGRSNHPCAKTPELHTGLGLGACSALATRPGIIFSSTCFQVLRLHVSIHAAATQHMHE
jgi:hypothetical protein